MNIFILRVQGKYFPPDDMSNDLIIIEAIRRSTMTTRKHPSMLFLLVVMLLLVGTSTTIGLAFSTTTRSSTTNSSHRYSHFHFGSNRHSHGFRNIFTPSTTGSYGSIKSSSPSAMHQTNNNSDLDGTTRGIPILIAALLVCIWSFSIPPEFRRAHICMTDQCVPIENRKYCHDCKTMKELKEGIQQYYANGGGVQFDFSIEEK